MTPKQSGRYIGILLTAVGILLIVFGLADWAFIAIHIPMPPKVMDWLHAYSRLGGALLILMGVGGGIAHKAQIGQRADRWLSAGHRARAILIGMVVLYIAFYMGFTFHRHYIFSSATYDLGIQDQVVWNTSQGRLFQESLEVPNYLGDHFQPLMGVLAILYWIYPSVYWLFAFQSVCLGLGAILLFRIAQRELESPLAGLAFALVYCLYPAIGYVMRFDFHFEIVVIPLLLAAWDALIQGHSGRASVCLTLALFGKEEVGLTVAMLGFVAALVTKRKRFGISWFVIGVTFSVLAMFVLIPAFRGGPSDTLARYGWLGQTPLQMLERILLDPLYVLKGIQQLGWFYMLGQLFGPVALLNLLSPVYLLAALPGIAYNLLSGFVGQHSAYFQYVVPIVPPILIGSVYGLSRLTRALPRFLGRYLPDWTGVDYRLMGLTALLACALFAFGADNPIQDRGVVPHAWLRMPNETAVREALDTIPKDARVFTTNQYGPHLTHRRYLAVYFYVPETARGVLSSDVVFFNLQDFRDTSRERYREMLEMSSEQGFGVIYHKDGVVVLQRGRGDPGAIADLVSRWLS